MNRLLYWSLIAGCTSVVVLFSRGTLEILSSVPLPKEVRAAEDGGGLSARPRTLLMGEFERSPQDRNSQIGSAGTPRSRSRRLPAKKLPESQLGQLDGTENDLAEAETHVLP